MPLILDTNEVISQTIDTLEINSFAVDNETQTAHIAFDKGILVNGVFSPIVKDLMLSVTGQDFIDAITEFEMGTSASKYADLKSALYTQLVKATGLTGTVQ